MEKKFILILLIFILLSSCTPSQNQITPTPSPRPRPNNEYDLGIWHLEIEKSMEDYISTILSNFDEHIDFQIEILPATSLEDEIIIFGSSLFYVGNPKSSLPATR
ncbi:MAG: hypothetical protein R6U57_00055 [Anaerolineales bacterium]